MLLSLFVGCCTESFRFVFSAKREVIHDRFKCCWSVKLYKIVLNVEEEWGNTIQNLTVENLKFYRTNLSVERL